MDYSLNEIKDLVTIAKPLIDPLVAGFIKPKIDRISAWIRKNRLKGEVEDHYFENKFQEYLARTYENCQNINILIFQNEQVKTADIYYPLTIECSKDHMQYIIDDFTLDVINPYSKILISDSAGMGKSTLTKYITLKTIQNSLAIPITIELRNLKENHGVLDEIFLQINPIDKSFDNELILKFIELGHFLILLDGFDEIQLKNQEAIIKDIRDFINKTSNNQFILTSRPEGALASFGDFQLFRINPLTENESFELIMKYDAICPNKVGRKLIEDIKENFNQTKELLRNPFLVSLIYSTYTYNQDIPSNKATFYEEIYSALFKRHDLSKDGWTRPKKSRLDIQQFKTVLRQLAFDTAVVGTIAYSETEIIQHIQNAKDKCPGIDFIVSEFLDDLLSAVPLFQKDGSKIKWAHKSLQDYFAADFIAYNSKKEHIIERIFTSKRDGFLNMLDLFYELDYKTFRNIIIYKLLSNFISYCNSSYIEIVGISKENILDRQAKTFESEVILFKMKKGFNLNESIEAINEKYPGFKDEKKMTLIISVEKIFILSSFSFERLIIELLADKKAHFITGDMQKSNKININFSGSDFIKIDDDPTSELNTKQNFPKVNKLIEYILRHRSQKPMAIINLDEAIIEVETIQREIEKERTIDNFDDI